MASSFSGAQRTLDSTKCQYHSAKDVIFVCENCDELACTDCATRQHKGHNLEGLSDIIPDVKQKLQDCVQTVENNDIPLIKGALQTADSDLSTNTKHYQEQIKKALDQNARLKKELDDITEKVIKSYRDMEQNNADILTIHRNELQSQADDLDSRIQEVKDTIHSADEVRMYEVSRNVFSKPTKIQQRKPPCLAEFTPAKVSLQKITQLFVNLNTPTGSKEIDELFKLKPDFQDLAVVDVMREVNPMRNFNFFGDFIEYKFRSMKKK